MADMLAACYDSPATPPIMLGSLIAACWQDQAQRSKQFPGMEAVFMSPMLDFAGAASSVV